MRTTQQDLTFNKNEDQMKLKISKLNSNQNISKNKNISKNIKNT